MFGRSLRVTRLKCGRWRLLCGVGQALLAGALGEAAGQDSFAPTPSFHSVNRAGRFEAERGGRLLLFSGSVGGLPLLLAWSLQALLF